MGNTMQLEHETYFLLGQEAVEIYTTEGWTALIEAFEDNEVNYDTFAVTPKTTPHQLLALGCKYRDYAEIPSFIYKKLN